MAVITGGAQGLGFGAAKRLGSEGAKLALLDMNEKLLGQATKELESGKIPSLAVQLDVTDHRAVKDAVKQVIAKFGRIDILINAAGITGNSNGKKSHEVDPDDFTRVWEVNVKGMFLCCREVLPHMLKANYGRIINIASMAGKDGNANMLPYASSKAAVIGLVKGMGKEYAETGITVNGIAPAVVRTAMVAGVPEDVIKGLTDKIPMKRTGEISELAALMAYIASRECSFTTGFIFDASGGRATY